MLAIAQIDRARDWPKTGGDQIAGLVYDGQLEGGIDQELAALRPSRDVELVRCTNVSGADIAQGLIDGANGSRDLFLECASETVGIVEGVVDRVLAFSPKLPLAGDIKA